MKRATERGDKQQTELKRDWKYKKKLDEGERKQGGEGAIVIIDISSPQLFGK